jgi:DNA (cytosine-5)-methyltransferase 1
MMGAPLKLISLFDGIGGFPLAWCRAKGITPINFHYYGSEIEEWPELVARSRFPLAEMLGDVTKITGDEFPENNDYVMTFGSPCQDLSVAGKGEGLEGERSGLFHEAIRIIQRVRPKYFIWENVAGAYSSNNGDDFARVLRSIAEIGYDACYTCIDAQWFGVPQRRRRIYLLGVRDGIPSGCDPLDFGRRSSKECAESIQSVAESRGGYSSKGRGTEETVAALTSSGIGVGGADVADAQSGHLIGSYAMQAIGEYADAGVASSLKERDYKDATDLIAFHGSQDPDISGQVTHPVGTNQGQETCILENHGQDSRIKKSEVSPTLSNKMGTGGNNVPLAFQPRVGRNGRGAPDNVAAPLDAEGGATSDKRQMVTTGQIIRRLTPVECLRLQGLPDDWLEGVAKYSDTKAYKAIGNGLAIDCAQWMIEKMLEFDKEISQ